MDTRVLGRKWLGQIMGRNPQIEEWAAAIAPDVGALQRLLSTLEDQRAVWSQVRVLRWGGSRSQQGEGEVSQNPLGVTGTKGGGDREVVDGPGPRRHQTCQWHPYVWGKRSGALRARVGQMTQRLWTGPPHQGCCREPPQEGSDPAGVRTR